ncbi:MAG TPA: YfcE family phosphodiesterase [archaeon]|nr:YfcE family phosphodiesterase [archaeon]
MKLLIFADIHGDLDKLYRTISQLDEKPDAVLVAGDFTPFGPASIVPDELKLLKQASPHVLAVPGNEDPDDVRKQMKDVNIHGKSVRLQDVDVIGFEGATWVDTDVGSMMSYEPVHEHFKNPGRRKLLLTHVPPFDTKVDRLWTGRHVGSPFLRSMVEEYQPDLVVSGHIHEARGVDRIGKTVVLNPGALADGYSAEVNMEKGKTPEIQTFKLTRKGLKKEKLEVPPPSGT